MESNKINAISESVSRGTLSATASDFLKEHLIKLSNLVDAKIFHKINIGEEVSYGELIAAYAEKNSYHRIMRTLSQSQKSGVTSGEKFKKLLEKSNGADSNRSNASFSTYRG